MKTLITTVLLGLALLVPTAAQAAPTGSLSLQPSDTQERVSGALSVTMTDADFPSRTDYPAKDWQVGITITSSQNCYGFFFERDSKFTSPILNGPQTYAVPFTFTYTSYAQMHICLYVNYISNSVATGYVCNDGWHMWASSGACGSHGGIWYVSERGQGALYSDLLAGQIIPSVVPAPTSTPAAAAPITPAPKVVKTLTTFDAKVITRKKLRKKYFSYRWGSHKRVTCYRMSRTTMRCEATWSYKHKHLRKALVITNDA